MYCSHSQKLVQNMSTDYAVYIKPEVDTHLFGCVDIWHWQQNWINQLIWNSQYKNRIKAKKLFLCRVFWSKREHLLSQTSAVFETGQKPLQTKCNTSRPFSTKQHKLSSCFHGWRTKENSLKVLQPNCEREYSFFFIYLFSFRTVDSQHPTTPTLLSCKFKKGKSSVFRCEFKTFL